MTESGLSFIPKEVFSEIVARSARLFKLTGYQHENPKGTPLSRQIIGEVYEKYRSMGTPKLNETFSQVKTPELVRQLRRALRALAQMIYRGICVINLLADYWELLNPKVRQNADAVTLVCTKDGLRKLEDGSYQLEVCPFGEAYMLSPGEPFFHQPTVNDLVCSGVFLGDDKVLTAAHYANRNNVRSLFFVFDFKMETPASPKIRMPEENIYRGEQILHRGYDDYESHFIGSDYAIVKLDRKVEGRNGVAVSKKNLYFEQQIYWVGHSCGIPLKYAPGEAIIDVKDSYFLSNMSVFSGNSGSPVFDAVTHELLGIISKGHSQDFHKTEDGFVAIRYPDYKRSSECTWCTQAKNFIDYCNDGGETIYG